METYQGNVEQNLPFMFLVLPDWWKTKYPAAVKNLEFNARRLTTPYDLYETLVDILNPERLPLTNPPNIATDSRGISWFQQIPDSRNHVTAGIPKEFSSCLKPHVVSNNDFIMLISASFLVSEINRMLKDYPQCEIVKLNRIVSVEMWSMDSKEKENLIDYSILAETEPGLINFYGTVRSVNNANWTVVGPIIRSTPSGEQSSCVEDFLLRLFCYCK